MSDQESDFSPPYDHDWNEIALGDYATEKDAEDALDSYLVMLTGFKVYREVVGEILQPRYGAKEKAVRIDRILVPMPSMEQHGWVHGCVGIECKKSGEKIGPPLAQALDYSRSAFRITPTGVLVLCKYIFLWPYPETFSTTASIQVQHNVGSSYASHIGRDWERFVLKLGNKNVLQFFPSQNRIEINPNISSGNRTGSR